MENFVKIIPKHHIYIVDDAQYAEKIKQSLHNKFGEEVFVSIFHDAESSVNELRKSVDKPQLAIMDYSKNSRVGNEKGEYIVDLIQKISPETGILILSDEKHIQPAARVLAHGAHGFVEKDQFALDHINTMVEKCLHPTMM